ncbi:MAG: tryptophan synthase subunit beta [Gammaproteobacteria bacterium]|nr:tryptophan synthase subunit beta [Gammaproteobacteria bacterium]
MKTNPSVNTAGRFGDFGGCYLPEVLIAPIQELAAGFKACMQDKKFIAEFNRLLVEYAGRVTALTEVANFSQAINGPRIFLKREDLLHTGAHKLNNALGQCLLAKRLGKTRVIAETGAGQHGVATATACAKLDLACVIYMGAVDMERQAPNVARMKLLGAEVISVEEGAKTLKDAVNAALRDWSECFTNTHYCIGSALGPHPYPQMVAEFQAVIGRETKAQCLEYLGCLPDYIVACVGGGSNAIGIFKEFLNDTEVKLIGVEAGGKSHKLGEHAARFLQQKAGVLHGYYSYLLQDEQGQVAATHSISAGLDYPGVGPQHAALHDNGRATYVAVNDQETLAAFKLLCQTEGIIPALESSHALAHVIKVAADLPKDSIVVINLSGRGDKDLPQLLAKHAKELGVEA